MRIAIAVHGRFHAFDLTRELIKKNHDVLLLTNYPKFAVEKFGIPSRNIKSFLTHGIISRVVNKIDTELIKNKSESYLHKMFGKWVKNKLSNKDFDVIVCWSGIGEETFDRFNHNPENTLLVCRRGSTHINTQYRLLHEEQKRTGFKQEKPSSWIISRENKEYDKADVVLVSSQFCKESFLNEGVPENKIELLLHGVNNAVFRPELSIIDERCKRILSGKPLRVINVGNFSFRKGMYDMKNIVKSLNKRFEFKFVGPVAKEAINLKSEIEPFAKFISKQDQSNLIKYYTWADLFVLPTLEEGYPAVLTHASASGIPILTTPNGAGNDIIVDGKNGWIRPARSPDKFIEVLDNCDKDRIKLAQVVKDSYNNYFHRDWSAVAGKFIEICSKRLKDSNKL
ncbi:MAG: glycosyltransferase family 4 protein [Thermodesulfobacteriota bacterium]